METIEPRDGCAEPVKQPMPTHTIIIFTVAIIIVICVIALVISTVISNKSKKSAVTTTDTPPSNTSNNKPNNKTDLADLKRKRKERREKFDKMNKNIETEEQAETNLQHVESDKPDSLDNDAPVLQSDNNDSNMTITAARFALIDLRSGGSTGSAAALATVEARSASEGVKGVRSDSNIQVIQSITAPAEHIVDDTDNVNDDDEDLINNFVLNNISDEQ